MAKFITLVGGVPRLRAEGATYTVYDESTAVGGGGITAGTAVSLPSSGTYENKELEVYINGSLQMVVSDYNYVGTIPRTQITFVENLYDGDVIRLRISSNVTPDSIYDESTNIGVGGISTGVNLTLPGGRTYNDVELKVYLNGQIMEPVFDYNYTGASTPRTQISFTFDLIEGDVVRYRIDNV